MSLWEQLDDPYKLAQALNTLGAIEHYAGRYDQARLHYERCLAMWRQLGDQGNLALVLSNLLVLELNSPDNLDRARSYGEESLRLAREIGYAQGAATTLTGLALVAEANGDAPAAATHFQESLSIYRELSDQGGVARALGGLSLAALDLGDLDLAIASSGESLRGFVAIDDLDGLAFALRVVGHVATAADVLEIVPKLLGAAEAIGEEIGAPPPPWWLRRLADTVNRLDAVLGEEQRTARWAEGRGWSSSRAADEAMSLTTMLAAGRRRSDA
jgi:tetratricopeptide (TPR) repeat protein